MDSLLQHNNFIKTFTFVHGKDGLMEDDWEFLNLLSHMDVPPFDKIQALKDMGNDLFRQNQFDPAGECYDKACRLLCFFVQAMDDVDFRVVANLAVSLNLNLAACANKLKAYEAAINFSSMVLHAFPNNAKALFRRGMAYLKLNKLLEARKDFEDAAVVEPKNRDVLRELSVVRNLLSTNSNGKREADESVVGNDKQKSKKVTPTLDIKGGDVNEEVVVETMDSSISDSCANADSNMVDAETLNVRENIISDMNVDTNPHQSHVPRVRDPSEIFHFRKKEKDRQQLKIDALMYQKLVDGKELIFYQKQLFTRMKVRIFQPLMCDSESSCSSISENDNKRGRRRRTKGRRRRKSCLGNEASTTEDYTEVEVEAEAENSSVVSQEQKPPSVQHPPSVCQPFLFVSESPKRRKVTTMRRIIPRNTQSQEDESPRHIFGVFDTPSISLPRTRCVSVSCRRYSSQAPKVKKRKEMSSYKNPYEPIMKKPCISSAPSPSLFVCSSVVITASDVESQISLM